MKKILSLLSITVLIAVLITACNSNSKTAEADAVARLKAYQDSVKFSADTAGLAQFQQWKAQNELTDAEMMGETNPSMTAANNAPRSYTPTRTRSSSVSRSSGTRSSSSGNTASAPARKKISKAAKGAVIGGVGGAVAGAVINKRNRVVGGVVGGILGAGVGYGIGRSQDKKDGRY
jgi:hypothetical protein